MADLEAIRDFDFDVDPALLFSDKPDDAARIAAARAGVPFIQVTSQFRAAAQGKELYFPLDGHLNVAGARTYAALLAPAIAPEFP
jgi:hypothetical protein